MRYLLPFVLTTLLAAAPATAGVIHACVKEVGGLLRIVDGPGECRAHETPLSWSAEVPAPASGPRIFAGCTEVTSTGGFGIGIANGQCAAEFGPQARMCRSPEVLDSLPVAGPSPCWVRPVFQPLANTSSPGDPPQIVDASGKTSVFTSGTPTRGNLSCNGWISSVDIDLGLIIASDSLGFFTRNCDAPASFACCAPAAD